MLAARSANPYKLVAQVSNQILPELYAKLLIWPSSFQFNLEQQRRREHQPLPLHDRLTRSDSIYIF